MVGRFSKKSTEGNSAEYNNADSSASDSDGTAGMRVVGAILGVALVIIGTTFSLYMFFRIGEAVMDPRGFREQVDRWEFVVRGRTTDAVGDAREPAALTSDNTGAAGNLLPPDTLEDRAEEAARFIERTFSRSARPIALFVMVVLVSMMVRILILLIDAGARLIHLAAGEKEFMKRLLREIAKKK